MSLHLDDDSDEPTSQPTELTLSSGVLLSGVLGLVLLCALFFWFGYSVRGGSRTVALPAAVAEPTSSEGTFSSFKPAAGSPLNANPATSSPASPTLVGSLASRPPTSPPLPATIRSTPPPSTPALAPASIQTAAGFYVQVAAVSHQQDADKLVATLRSEGYLVTARTTAQDTLVHVQIGPYSSRKDADLIRQKLAAEGYTPIVK